MVDSLGSPLEGVTVWIKELETNNFLGETLTASDGTYTLPAIPSGTEFSFGVGGIVGFYSFEGDEAFVPDEIVNLEDTLNSNYHWKLPYNSIGVPAYKIRDFSGSSNVEAGVDKVEIYVKDGDEGFSQPQINAIWTGLYELASIIAPGNDTLFVPSDIELNENISGYDPYTNQLPVGVNIVPGNNNTDADHIYVTTPLGNTLIASFSAEMGLVPGSYLSLFHEMGRALGCQQTGWEGIMNVYAQSFTDTDKFIWRMDLSHYRDVYNGVVYFGLRNIVDELSTSKKGNNKSNSGRDKPGE